MKLRTFWRLRCAAREALKESEEDLERAKGRRWDFEAVGDDLRRVQRENGFAPDFRRALGGR